VEEEVGVSHEINSSFRKPRSGCLESTLTILVMDSGLALRAPRNDDDWVIHPTLITITPSTDSSSTLVTSCSEAIGWVRQRMTFSESDRPASKNSGS
jgi:hypothetical protein